MKVGPTYSAHAYPGGGQYGHVIFTTSEIFSIPSLILPTSMLTLTFIFARSVKKSMYRIIPLILAILFGSALYAQAEPETQRAARRVDTVESRLSRLENRGRNVSTAGGVGFLFGAFCALWAQNSGRSAWLWFFLGLIFSVITVLVLLAKNSGDVNEKTRGATQPPDLHKLGQHEESS